LDQFDKGLQNSLFISIVLFSLCPEPISRSLLSELVATVGSRGTSISDFDTALGSICAKFAYVCTPKNGGAAEFFARILGQGLSLLSSCARPAACLIKRDSAPA
jgi:hypothetical protein